MSAYIAIDDDLDEVSSPDCPALYEVIVLRNITHFMEAEQITIEEFHHYCKRLTDTLARRPRRAA